jgi:putative oxidoreductase
MSIQTREQEILQELKDLLPATSATSVKHQDAVLTDLSKFIARGVVGSFMTAHGLQKLFGLFGGPGFKGTTGYMSMLGLKPEKLWAMLAGASEFGGGALSTLGLLHPLGPIAVAGTMGTAAGTYHELFGGKPIWITEGGAETPLTLFIIAAGLAMAKPGRFSLDHLLGNRVPKTVSVLVATVVMASVLVSIRQHQAAVAAQAQSQEQQAQAEEAAQPA